MNYDKAVEYAAMELSLAEQDLRFETESGVDAFELEPLQEAVQFFGYVLNMLRKGA